MSGFDTIDFSQLPAPDVVESLEYEAVLAEVTAVFVGLYPDYTATVESDPVRKLLELAAYRELKLRQRVNDAGRAVMLPWSGGNDLDNLAALVPVARLTITPGDAQAIPPIVPIMEADADFRTRVQLAPEAFSVAGPDGGYKYHALTVPEVKDAYPHSPAPVDVELYVLAREGNGLPAQTVLDAVTAAVNAKDVRPLTDRLAVLPAEIIEYEVIATLIIGTGPSAGNVESAARANMQALADARHRFGAGVPLSAIYAALHVEGVLRVDLAMTDGVTVQPHQAAYCTGIALTVEAANG